MVARCCHCIILTAVSTTCKFRRECRRCTHVRRQCYHGLQNYECIVAMRRCYARAVRVFCTILSSPIAQLCLQWHVTIQTQHQSDVYGISARQRKQFSSILQRRQCSYNGVAWAGLYLNSSAYQVISINIGKKPYSLHNCRKKKNREKTNRKTVRARCVENLTKT